MQSHGVKPYNNNLHMILGAATEMYTSNLKWYNFAQYMNWGKRVYGPYTIRNAYYQANIDAFANAPLPDDASITLAVAGDSACLELHIPFSEITGAHGTDKIGFSQPVTLFFVNDTTVTNIPYRTVYFRRTVDGMPVIGRFYRFNVGEHGRITKMSIAWPNLKRIKSLPTISPDDVVNCIRNGDAIKGPLPTNIGDIDWSKIKSVAIKKATPSYQKDNDQLYPLLRLDVVVDTGDVNVEMGMDCPIFDENKP
jgi:hypothetical protein